jgi:hypothetical protein
MIPNIIQLKMKTILLFSILIFFITEVKAGYRNGPFQITATEASLYGGGFAKALVYTDCANMDKIRKPLIVFEGYDPGFYTMPKEKEGRTGIQKFLDDVKEFGETQFKVLLWAILVSVPQLYNNRTSCM